MKKKNKKTAFIIGLTGSIGMGKTTVANMFNEAGIPISNADMDVAKSMDINGECVIEIAKYFPETLAYDNEATTYIDKKKLAKIVFNNKNTNKSLDILEKILHPVVSKSRQNFIQEMTDNGHDIVLCDIPLLFENNLEAAMDLTICVSASKKTQKQRVLARPNMTVEKLETILKRQMPDKEKRKRADIIIDTDCTINNTKQQVQKIIHNIMTDN